MQLELQMSKLPKVCQIKCETLWSSNQRWALTSIWSKIAKCKLQQHQSTSISCWCEGSNPSLKGIKKTPRDTLQSLEWRLFVQLGLNKYMCKWNKANWTAESGTKGDVLFCGCRKEMRPARRHVIRNGCAGWMLAVVCVVNWLLNRHFCVNPANLRHSDRQRGEWGRKSTSEHLREGFEGYLSCVSEKSSAVDAKKSDESWLKLMYGQKACLTSFRFHCCYLARLMIV